MTYVWPPTPSVDSFVKCHLADRAPFLPALQYNTSLAQPHRRFVYQGDVFSLVGKAQKERRLFLFNDVLLCTKKKHKNNLKVDFLEPLEMLRVEEPEELRGTCLFFPSRSAMT